MTRLALPLLAFPFLMGCVVPVPVLEGTPGSIQVFPGDPCGARGLQSFIGQDESVVLATTFQAPGAIRVIGPNDVVTQELNPQRINFRTDASGEIVAVYCG